MAPACPAWDSFIELRVGRSSLGDSPPFQPAQPHSAEPMDTHVMQYMAALSCSPSWSLLRALAKSQAAEEERTLAMWLGPVPHSDLGPRLPQGVAVGPQSEGMSLVGGTQ